MRGLRARWGLEGVDRVCVDLAGKVVVGVKVCVKIGSKVCSEDGFKSGCYVSVKGCSRGCFEGSFWAFGEVKISFKVFVKRRRWAEGRKSNNFLRDGASKFGPSTRPRSSSTSSSRKVLGSWEEERQLPSGWSLKNQLEGIIDETLPGGRIVEKLKRREWKEEHQLPSGWNVKSIVRLEMFDWKGRQEFPSGWSFKAVRN